MQQSRQNLTIQTYLISTLYYNIIAMYYNIIFEKIICCRVSFFKGSKCLLYNYVKIVIYDEKKRSLNLERTINDYVLLLMFRCRWHVNKKKPKLPFTPNVLIETMSERINLPWQTVNITNLIKLWRLWWATKY